jgi:hypothetical protein
MAVGVHQKVDLAHSGTVYTFFLHTAFGGINYTYRRHTGSPSLEKYSANPKGSYVLSFSLLYSSRESREAQQEFNVWNRTYSLKSGYYCRNHSRAPAGVLHPPVHIFFPLVLHPPTATRPHCRKRSRGGWVVKKKNDERPAA